MKNVIYSRTDVQDKEDLIRVINSSKYAIDDSNYSNSTAFIKYILLDEHFRPTLIIKFDRNDEEEEKLFRLFYKYSELGYNKGRIEELCICVDYVVSKKSSLKM